MAVLAGEDEWSFQEEMALGDLEASEVAKPIADEALRLRRGWNSERVSGTEIRERLSALAGAGAATALGVHSDGASPPQSPSARPPGAAQHSNFKGGGGRFRELTRRSGRLGVLKLGRLWKLGRSRWKRCQEG